jgi:preprotein translocase subunit SecD
MRIWPRHFNLYFTLVLALASCLLCGCETAKHKKDKQVSAMRIHLEADADVPDVTQSISILRTDPIQLTIDKEPIFTEVNLVTTKVVDTQDGFAIQFSFDESSTLILEQYTASNLGKHFAIFGQWGEKLADGRWLAAPMITRRVFDGSLTFTPDMSREEADQFVLGLSHAIKQDQKGQQ